MGHINVNKHGCFQTKTQKNEAFFFNIVIKWDLEQ